MDLIGLNRNATELIFLTVSPASKMKLFSYIVLRVKRLTYNPGLIRFSNRVRLSRLGLVSDALF